MDVATGMILLIVAFFLFTESGRVILAAIIVIGGIVLMVGAASPAYSAESDTVEAHSTMALCAAASGLVAAKQSGYVSKVIGEVGTNYRAWLVLEIMATGETDADGIADILIAGMMRKIQSEYNSGSITWEELVGYARGCAIAWEESH